MTSKSRPASGSQSRTASHGHHAQWAELGTGPVPTYNMPISLTIPKLNPTRQKAQIAYWSVKESEPRRMFLVCLYMTSLYMNIPRGHIIKMVILLPPNSPTYFILYLSKLFPEYLFEVWSEGADPRLRGKFYEKRRGIIVNDKSLSEFLGNPYSNRDDVIVSFHPDPETNQQIRTIKKPRIMNFDLNLYSINNLPPFTLLRQVYSNPDASMVSVLTERVDNGQFTVEELRDQVTSFNVRNRAGIWTNPIVKEGIRIPDFDDCYDCSMEYNLWELYLNGQGLDSDVKDVERYIRDLGRYMG